MYDLAAFGIITGFISGFFGVGGGMILVPMLLLSGFVMKEAVAISIMQMVFSSIYGSFLNSKKATNVIKDGIMLGIGGFVGGLQSGYIVTNVSNEFLQYLFILILFYSIIKIFITPAEHDCDQRSKNKLTLFIIGFFTGLIAMSIGVGGSVILIPILIGFLKYDLKAATALSLFFVIFSSIAGFTSLSLSGHMLYTEGTIIGVFSLIGVYFGIIVKHKVHSNSYKKYILVLNAIILVTMIYKTF
ncbi:sulfite exporter TauE/SafE family protein [Poseidonibacter lekithochrous]|uniref:sulfite exporter TauE/SafE family protein n=1 Tax=Poseidonibacter TaxID=2321187 RepID=UPI001C0A17BA|nr:MULTISPECIES: sulfite exporter TauE/SafE family protein [Poseidonibacter]MBU3013638.1 sulfite exporter TauE/SafE family protein [Poseidonibacter lekithochrous]MDO6826935.1 sulfite exporter TauE/SafE family protein [Poseidonibacter sp. 1_MG-2023]